jgi:hypothetical protein
LKKKISGKKSQIGLDTKMTVGRNVTDLETNPSVTMLAGSAATDNYLHTRPLVREGAIK